MLEILKQSTISFFKVLKGSALLIVAVFALIFINIHFFMPDLAQLSIGINIAVLIKLNIYLIIFIFVYILTLLIVGYELIDNNEPNFISYFKSRFVKLFTDLTRAYNQILLLALLLLLPGLYRYIRLIFVPFVSMEYKDAPEDQRPDSLKRSTKLTGSIKTFVILFVVYLVFLPVDLATAFIMNDSALNTLLLSLLSLCPIYFHCIVLQIYKSMSQEMKLGE